MKNVIFLKTLFLISCLGIISVSCDSDSDNSQEKPNVDPPKQAVAKYVVAFQENKIGDAAPVDYILEFSSLEDLKKGAFDVKGKGITQTGWRFFYQANNTLFTAGYSTDVTCNAYALNEAGNLAQKASFTFDKTLDCFTTSEDGTKLIAVQLHHLGHAKKRFHIVDVASGKVENIIEHEVDIDKGDGTKENPGYLPWISGMVQQNEKLYIAYFKWTADGEYISPDTDRAYVAIFSYPEMKFDKIIYDDRTSPIGINGGDTGIVKDENGDMYTASSSALSAGFTAATKPSGVLRIKKGATEFDKNYFFDVENATNGGKLYWMKYVGNGKALARIILDDTQGAYEWGSFLSNDALKLVVLDLDAKTVTDVQGAPNPHGQRYSSGTGVLIEDGKAYLGISDATETAVYMVDPETATATKGAVAVNAKSLKGIFKL